MRCGPCHRPFIKMSGSACVCASGSQRRDICWVGMSGGTIDQKLWPWSKEEPTVRHFLSLKSRESGPMPLPTSHNYIGFSTVFTNEITAKCHSFQGFSLHCCTTCCSQSNYERTCWLQLICRFKIYRTIPGEKLVFCNWTIPQWHCQEQRVIAVQQPRVSW